MSRKVLNKNFCVIPWTGFELEPNGDVKNCIISRDVIGNISQTPIDKIFRNSIYSMKFSDALSCIVPMFFC